MKNIPTFEEFLIMENANGVRVCVMPGRFQPFHLGHLAALERTSKEFGCPVIPIQIISKNEKSPFPDSLLNRIGNAVAKEYSRFIAKYVLYPQTLKPVIPQMVLLLQKEGFNPIGMGCGSDRLKSYESQIRYINSDRSDVAITEPFILKNVDERLTDGPSGTRVRAAITEDDKKSFEKMTPKSIHQYYDELKRHLQ